MEAVRDPGHEKPSAAVIAPVVPLALLESVRALDRPQEILEDENIATSLPRRLGLTDVIDAQIRRYQESTRRGRRLPADELADLLRLILRRPDAEAVLRDAGRNLARLHFRFVPSAAVVVLRILPARLTMAAVRRSARRMLARIAAPARPSAAGFPMVVRMPDALTADIDPSGTACALYTASLEELVRLMTRGRAEVRHEECRARGAAACEWRLRP